jgi:hypothetical protein
MRPYEQQDSYGQANDSDYLLHRNVMRLSIAVKFATHKIAKFPSKLFMEEVAPDSITAYPLTRLMRIKKYHHAPLQMR